MHMPCRGAVGNHGDGLVSGVCRERLDLHIQHCGQTTQTLGTNAESVDLVHQFDPQSLRPVLRTTSPQFRHVQRFHERFLGQQHGLFRRATDANPKNAWRTPAGTHGRHHTEHPVRHRIGRVEHGKLGLCFTATTFGGDFNFQLVTRHDLHVNDRRCVVLGVSAQTIRIFQHGSAQHIVRKEVAAPNACVDHLLHRQGAFPLNLHADGEEHIDDAGILADGSFANGAHAGIHQHLGQRRLGGWRLLLFPRLDHGSQKVGRVIVGNELQCIGHTLDQVFLADDGHGISHKRW